MLYRSNTPCKHPSCEKLVAYGNKLCGDHEVCSVVTGKAVVSMGTTLMLQV